jgi:hypothetical protein
MEKRKHVTEQSSKKKPTNLPVRKVEKAEQIKGGGQRHQDIIAI